MNAFLFSVALMAANNASAEPSLVKELSIDASDKTLFRHFALQKGELVPVTETDDWIFAVRRYIFKTHTGSNGSFSGGAYLEGKDLPFDAACVTKHFEVDQEVTMAGFTVSANMTLTQWFDYDDLGSIIPLDQTYAIGRDRDCLKIKILSYDAGQYTIQYQQVL